MGFRRASGFALGVGLRAVLIGALAFGAIFAASHAAYATALVLSALALLTGADLARQARAADRALAQFIDGLDAEGSEWPSPGLSGLPDLAAAMERAKTRLIRGRAEVRANSDYFQALADSVPAALMVIDPAGVMRPANQAAYRLFGEGDVLVALGPEATAILTRLAVGADEIVRTPDGRNLLAVCSGFSTPSRGPSRLMALQRLEGDLDAVQLKAWRDLVQVLSHELMNSLTPICSLAESSAALLRDPKADKGPVAEAVDVIARRSVGLMDFVERYRRIADLPPPIRAPIHAADLVAAADHLMGGLIRGKGVAYESRVEPASLMLDVDASLLEQAVINLLKNALDAVAGRAGAKIGLTVEDVEDAVILTVRDNGPGLSLQALETLFVPFFTTKSGGSGIGLSLARQIARAHDGRLEYAGNDEGAVFRLVLPREAGLPASTPAPGPPSPR